MRRFLVIVLVMVLVALAINWYLQQDDSAKPTEPTSDSSTEAAVS